MLGFESLPFEVLKLICNYVEDVNAFVLVSKTCLSAIASQRCAEIKIFYSTAEALVADIDRWTTRLEKSGNLHHVRSLNLCTAPKVAHRVPFQALWDTDDEGLNTRWQHRGGFGQVIPGSEEDAIWQPVADFIQRLPGLTDLHYSCEPQLTACLLDAVEAKEGCGLHLDSFRLRSLHECPPKRDRVEPYERRLATSSHLHGIISTPFERLDDITRVNYLDDAAKCMTSGFAPNLKSVSLRWFQGPSSLAMLNAAGRPIADWTGTEFGERTSNISKGSLTFLEFIGRHICDIQNLRSWAVVTDFSKLKTLKIRDNVGPAILDWLTEEVDLSSLRTLVLELSAFQDEEHSGRVREVDWDAEDAELYRRLIVLASKLPPLHTLHLSGDCDYHTLGQIMQCHGRTLQKMVAYGDQHSHPYGYRFINIAEEQWLCSSLKELSISVLRTDGDRDEVRQYEWLGKGFPDLRRLRITLDCRKPGPRLEDDDEKRQETGPNIYRYPNEGSMDIEYDSDGNEIEPKDDPSNPADKVYDLRYILRNYAVDSTLAEAIFRKISSSKPTGSPPLESLRLRVRKERSSSWTYPEDFDAVCTKVLGKCWLCTLSPMGEQIQRVVTKEIFFAHPDGDKVQENFDDEAVQIFHTQWPAQPGKDWRECWHSYPLATEDKSANE